jgi:hypothetical protein
VRLGHDADHSPPFSAEDVNEQEHPLLPCASIGVLWNSYTITTCSNKTKLLQPLDCPCAVGTHTVFLSYCIFTRC